MFEQKGAQAGRGSAQPTGQRSPIGDTPVKDAARKERRRTGKEKNSSGTLRLR
jgi:hypothetical protein